MSGSEISAVQSALVGVFGPPVFTEACNEALDVSTSSVPTVSRWTRGVSHMGLVLNLKMKKDQESYVAQISSTRPRLPPVPRWTDRAFQVVWVWVSNLLQDPEVEFVSAVSAGGSVKFLPAV